MKITKSPTDNQRINWATKLSVLGLLTVTQVAAHIRTQAAFLPPPFHKTDGLRQISDWEGKFRHTQQTLQNQQKDFGAFVKFGLHLATDNFVISEIWDQENVNKCSEIWNLNPDEKQKLLRLQTQLQDVEHWKNNPFEVVRFLREYKGNVEEAESSFRNMVEWRKKENIDNLMNDYKPPSLYRYFPVAILKGVDRDGDPIHVERTGVADSIGLLHRYGQDEMVKYGVWIREVQNRGKWHQEYEASQGHPVKAFTVIIDMDGLDRKRMLHSKLMAAGKEVSRIVQDYYPGFTKRIIILRAPSIFKMAWSMFKPFVKQSLQDVMVFTSSKDYQQVLEQYIDLKVLPVALVSQGEGESVDDFNPAWYGGPIPEFEEEEPIEVLTYTESVAVQENLNEIIEKSNEKLLETPILLETEDLSEEEDSESSMILASEEISAEEVAEPPAIIMADQNAFSDPVSPSAVAEPNSELNTAAIPVAILESKRSENVAFVKPPVAPSQKVVNRASRKKNAYCRSLPKRVSFATSFARWAAFVNDAPTQQQSLSLITQQNLI